MSAPTIPDPIGERTGGDEQWIHIDHAVRPFPRHGWGREGHRRLDAIIRRGWDSYRARLDRIASCADLLAAIPLEGAPAGEPQWVNDFISLLDASALYTIIATERPAQYMEIGSGHSTRFARRAIRDHGLQTTITSIDPMPRADVDALCDHAIRQSLEETDLSLLHELRAGDVLFFDGTHRSFTNSDVTVFFLDVLPELADGVIVHIHDVWLPYDYPPEWNDRFYSEQYLLAAWLLAEGRRLEILLPNAFVTFEPELSALVTPLRQRIPDGRVYEGGCSFWFRMHPSASTSEA
ncbi:MAG: hypothetical protein JWN29_3071 [Acidimicrobiales bacterium]|nr:hypothetical protein [Acidimicrobiales bacterium]